MMTLTRARIIKASSTLSAGDASPASSEDGAPGAVAVRRTTRIIPREILDARSEGARIVAEAHDRASAVAKSAADVAAKEAREEEIAKLAAGFLALREAEAKQTATQTDRIVDLAVLLAERLLGESIRVEPTRIAELAATAIQEARGARRVRIEAAPDDVDALKSTLGSIGLEVADIEPDPSLSRGSLVVHTDLGRVDARLEPQLTRLATALREALASS